MDVYGLTKYYSSGLNRNKHVLSWVMHHGTCCPTLFPWIHTNSIVGQQSGTHGIWGRFVILETRWIDWYHFCNLSQFTPIGPRSDGREFSISEISTKPLLILRLFLSHLVTFCPTKKWTKRRKMGHISQTVQNGTEMSHFGTIICQKVGKRRIMGHMSHYVDAMSHYVSWACSQCSWWLLSAFKCFHICCSVALTCKFQIANVANIFHCSIELQSAPECSKSASDCSRVHDGTLCPIMSHSVKGLYFCSVEAKGHLLSSI